MKDYVSLAELESVDLRTVNKEDLVDVTGFTFDETIPQEERLARLIERVKNPFCYRVGPMAVKIEFTENGPLLHELLIDFFKRKKSGL